MSDRKNAKNCRVISENVHPSRFGSLSSPEANTFGVGAYFSSLESLSSKAIEAYRRPKEYQSRGCIKSNYATILA